MTSVARHFIGVDLHKKALQFCVLDDRGNLLHEQAVKIAPDAAAEMVFNSFRPWQGTCRVAVEAVGMNRWFVNGLQARGYDVVVADPIAEPEGAGQEDGQAGCAGDRPPAVAGGHRPRREDVVSGRRCVRRPQAGADAAAVDEASAWSEQRDPCAAACVQHQPAGNDAPQQEGRRRPAGDPDAERVVDR
ncbi:MAG: transposase [bacterium]|nr:transposase [bacterium]